VSEGLGYLHSMNIVHGDLRGANILVSDDLNACLADFGLTSAIAASLTSGTSSTNRAGSTRWLAPELLQPEAFGCDGYVRTLASDVYAFACVCLEASPLNQGTRLTVLRCFQLHTGGPPFLNEAKEDAAVIFNVIKGQRPVRPKASMSDDLWELVTAAWAQNFCDRPKIETIIGRMRTNAGIL
jgi:serine/threonine protein kinase